DAEEARLLEHRAQPRAIRQELLQHSARARKERNVRVRRNLFMSPCPHHDRSVHVQPPAAFPRSGSWIAKMVKRHRHENHVDRLAEEWDRFRGAALVVNCSASRCPTCLIEHLPGGINADNRGAESIRQGFGESPGPTAQVEDRADGLATNVGLDDAHPKVENLRTVIASAIVTGWNVGLVVVRRFHSLRIFGASVTHWSSRLWLARVNDNGNDVGIESAGLFSAACAHVSP